MGGRAPVKTLILRCVECARHRGIRARQLMVQLPHSRITPSRPFMHTGIDYAGPSIIKTWRGQGEKTQEAWVCVFVCMSTSAVHLEAVGDYSTEGFLATYRRFTSQREICQTIHSDCGGNFIGADVELKRLFTQFTREHEVILQFMINSGTQWTFNPPAALHMGSKWESVVKSLKFYLTRMIKESLFTFKEITTLLTQIEAILNSRPLEPISDDPEDTQAFTLGHFFTGSELNYKQFRSGFIEPGQFKLVPWFYSRMNDSHLRDGLSYASLNFIQGKMDFHELLQSRHQQQHSSGQWSN